MSIAAVAWHFMSFPGTTLPNIISYYVESWREKSRGTEQLFEERKWSHIEKTHCRDGGGKKNMKRDWGVG